MDISLVDEVRPGTWLLVHGGVALEQLTGTGMTSQQGSEYDRLFYPFLFEGGQVQLADVLAQVRHSTLEKCREVIGLRAPRSLAIRMKLSRLVRRWQRPLQTAQRCSHLEMAVARPMRRTLWLTCLIRPSQAGNLCLRLRSQTISRAIYRGCQRCGV